MTSADFPKTRADSLDAATSIIPQQDGFSERAAKRASAKCLAPARTTQQSYEDAAAQCRHKVAQIVKECRRVNQKYRDPHFDLEIDLKLNRRDCLDSLDNVKDDDRSDDYCRDPPLKDRDHQQHAATANSVMGMLDRIERENAVAAAADGDGESKLRPQAVKRVVDIFDDPKFFIDGPTAHDVRQGRDGDCWLMAALCTISNKSGLIERCCVAHDQEVGVYGFVFHRDGEWFSEIIDDKVSPPWLLVPLTWIKTPEQWLGSRNTWALTPACSCILQNPIMTSGAWSVLYGKTESG